MIKVYAKAAAGVMVFAMAVSLTTAPSFAASKKERAMAEKLGLVGTFILQAKKSGKCLATAGGAKMGKQFHAWRCREKSSNQPFRIKRTDGPWFMVHSLKGSQCLDVSGGSKKTGKPVVQWSCKGSTNQQWKLAKGGSRRSFRLIVRHSGKCLTLDNPDERISRFIQRKCGAKDAHQDFVTKK